MSTDYRRKPPSRSYSRKAKNSGSSKSTFLGIFIGLIVAGVGWYYAPVISEKISTVKLHRPGEVHDPASRKEKKPAIEATAVKPKSSAPEFDFYTVLPKNQVDANAVANSVAKKPASAPVTVSAPAISNVAPASVNTIDSSPAQMPPSAAQVSVPAAVTPSVPVKSTAPVEVAEPAQRFTLQTASLKNYDDADSLKAQLTMLGFDVAIQKYTINNQVRYRVFAGSYASKGAALKQQAMLKDNGISSILIKQSQ